MTFHVCIFQDDSGQRVKGRQGDKSGSEKPGGGHGNDLEKRHMGDRHRYLRGRVNRTRGPTRRGLAALRRVGVESGVVKAPPRPRKRHLHGGRMRNVGGDS